MIVTDEGDRKLPLAVSFSYMKINQSIHHR